MHRERNRLETKLRDNLRNVDPSQAVLFHLRDMWTSQTAPDIENMDTIGTVVSNVYSDAEDYLIVLPKSYVLVGKNASVIYGEFDGFTSVNVTRKQIIDGLGREKSYTIYKINPQYVDNGERRNIVTLMEVDSVEVSTRSVISSGYKFKMDEIDLDKSNNTFVVKELFFDGIQYFTKSGTFVKNIVPRKVTMIDAQTSDTHEVYTGSILEDPNGERQTTPEDSIDEDLR